MRTCNSGQYLHNDFANRLEAYVFASSQALETFSSNENNLQSDDRD